MALFPPHPERRAAVVTGASAGIGQATAVALAAAGYPVVLGARRINRLDEVVARIRATDGEAWALPLDVGDNESIRSFALAAEETAGPLEVIVSNAGDTAPLGTVATSPDEFARLVAVNLLGVQTLLHHTVPSMIARGRGDVVLVTSDVARQPRPFMAGYVAAKHGLEGLAQAFRMELEGTGVRVGMVRPGPTATEQGSTWSPEHTEAVLDEWTRWGLFRHHGYLLPEHLAAAVLTMITAPRGANITLLELQPEAPIRKTDKGGSS